MKKRFKEKKTVLKILSNFNFKRDSLKVFKQYWNWWRLQKAEEKKGHIETRKTHGSKDKIYSTFKGFQRWSMSISRISLSVLFLILKYEKYVIYSTLGTLSDSDNFVQLFLKAKTFSS
mgnify:CR=1 FL=1